MTIPSYQQLMRPVLEVCAGRDERYAPGNSVGSAAIRDFFGSLDLHRAGKGVFITSSAFTENARATAGRLEKRIVRIAETLHIKRIDEDLFSE